MGFRDDDDEELFISRSSEGAFKNPDQAKREAREQKAKSKGKLFGLQRALLAQQMTKGAESSAAEMDGETKRQRQSEEDANNKETFGTKTHKQIEEAETLGAQTDLTAEQIMAMEQGEEKQEEQAGQEYAGDEA